MGSHETNDRENPEQGRSDRNGTWEREDRLGAYVDGEMTPAEAAAFERDMEADEALRREVDAWREAIEAASDWMDVDAPGIERVAHLAIPSVAARGEVSPAASGRGDSGRGRARVVAVPSVFWRVAAAAAIFVAGFYIGYASQQGESTPAGIPIKAGSTPEQPISDASDREVAQLPARRYSTDSRGRIVVHTTLAGSSGSALFVIDRDFEVGQ